MTIFELVKVALDVLYDEGEKRFGTSLDDEIRNRLRYLTTSYNQLNYAYREPVDYSDPATRFAYVYKYVAAHGDYVVQVMESLRYQLGSSIFKKESLRLSCVGGGPGSDIIAVLKYLNDHKSEPVTKVICYLLDREQAWADTWTELDESIESRVRLNANFQPLDVTDSESWQYQQKFLQADLFTMSYFVSEVFSLDKDGGVTNFWKQLFDRAKPGAFFLYDDNGHGDFNNYFDLLWKGAGLNLIMGADNIRVVPRFSEESSELRTYREKFDHSPKLQSFISYRVLQKPIT